MESLVVAKEAMEQLESMIIGREPMANGITFVQQEINSTCKQTSKGTNGIPMESMISLIIAKEPIRYQYGINCNCKGTNVISLVQH
jgi:hypothetical protein